MEPSSAWMAPMSWAAGSPLKTALCAVTTRPAVSPRAGCVMATPTVLTEKTNKDVVSSMEVTWSISNYTVVSSPYLWELHPKRWNRTLQMVTAAMKLKDTCSFEEKL